MSLLYRAGLYLQALLYIASGVNHFWHASSYVRIMPDYVPAHGAMVAISGVCELIGGVGLLFPASRRIAALGIATMLVVFLTVHVGMIEHHADRFASIPILLLWARLLFQPVLIAWAMFYAKTRSLFEARG